MDKNFRASAHGVKALLATLDIKGQGFTIRFSSPTVTEDSTSIDLYYLPATLQAVKSSLLNFISKCPEQQFATLKLSTLDADGIAVCKLSLLTSSYYGLSVNGKITPVDLCSISNFIEFSNLLATRYQLQELDGHNNRSVN